MSKKMKIRYVGCYGEIEVPLYAIVKNGETVDVPEDIGRNLIRTGEFEEVEEKKKKIGKIREDIDEIFEDKIEEKLT